MAVIKRKVVDDLVNEKTSPMELARNERYSSLGITETTRVKDKRETITLNKKRVAGSIDFISQIRTAYASIASTMTEGELVVSNNGVSKSIVIPIANLRLLKALIWCSKSGDLEFSYVLVEAVKPILAQTVNRQKPHYDKDDNPYVDEFQKLVYDEIMEFYLEKCS